VAPLTKLLLAAGTLAAAGLAAAALALPASGSGSAARPSSDRLLAEQTISRYFALLNAGRGTKFCTGSITAATLRAEGGLAGCIRSSGGYVKRMRTQTYALTLQNMHYLFTQLSDGINLHCRAGAQCPSWHFATWATATYPGEIDWVTSTDAGLASSTGRKVVAVVDPARSSTHRITLYYQAWDGRILRASWSTKAGGWYGTVVDTHAGRPLITGVNIVTVRRTGPDAIVALVSLRVGILPRTWESFHLVREGGRWRADTWIQVAGPPAA
jgi:hypothetical protein